MRTMLTLNLGRKQDIGNWNGRRMPSGVGSVGGPGRERMEEVEWRQQCSEVGKACEQCILQHL